MTRALVLLAAVALAAGCGGGSKSAQTTTGTTFTTTNPTGTARAKFQYPAAVTQNYMRSCLASPKTNRAYCTCTLDKLSERVSTADFKQIALSGGEIPPKIRAVILRAAQTCRSKL